MGYIQYKKLKCALWLMDSLVSRSQTLRESGYARLRTPLASYLHGSLAVLWTDYSIKLDKRIYPVAPNPILCFERDAQKGNSKNCNYFSLWV